jgi:hypothetical protein
VKTTFFPPVPLEELKEGEASTATMVEEISDTLHGAPMIRVNGFYYVRDNDMRLKKGAREGRWSIDETRCTFLFKRRLWTRLDQTAAFQNAFGTLYRVSDETLAKLKSLSANTSEPTKG